jgi:AhpD family alkylhydroperoxidase
MALVAFLTVFIDRPLLEYRWAVWRHPTNFPRGCHIGGIRLVMMLQPNRRKQAMNANDLFAAAPELMKKWMAASLAAASSLEPALLRLVEIRASQINGCANCINMHTKDARAQGESEERIYLLSAWREAPCYTDRERAALGWTEALTRLSGGHALEGAREALQAQFSKEEQVKFTLMINVINGWNRISVGFGMFLDPATAKTAAQAAA